MLDCCIHLPSLPMKGFLKNVLATITGLLVVCLLAFIIIWQIVTPSKYKLKEDTVLVLNLNGILNERTTNDPVLQYMGIGDVNEIILPDVLSAIKKAKENDKIKGIYIRSGYISASYAALQEIREELKSFKESGKFIIAYGDLYPQKSYIFTSVADKIILNPQGNIDLHGINSSRMFYKGLFEKIGVEVQVFKVGTYKSAVEPFMQDKMSEANKEQVSSYINDIWTTNIYEISESRGISVNSLNLIADSLTVLRSAQSMVDKKLVDTLLYETDVQKLLASLVGKDNFKDINKAYPSDLRDTEYKNRSDSKNKIAILYAEGGISSGNSSNEIYDRYYVKELEKLKDDKDIKAVVFRINSGGGSAYASEQIWKAVSELKAVKPIVVSMGGYAASGGYYIACNANKIIAQPTTLTGSIGIFGLFPNVEGLTQKIGFTYDNVKTNILSDFGDITRPMKEEEKVIFQNYINDGYDLFITRCAESRGISKDSINQIAQGRVWTGKQALEIGLVDKLGGIYMALDEAAILANITDYEIKEYPKRKDFWEEINGLSRKTIASSLIKDYFGDEYKLIKTVKGIKELNEQDFIQARLPYDFSVE